MSTPGLWRKTHAGRLYVTAVLSSLYPAAFVLREHATRIQAIGILIALAAVSLISA